MIQAPTQQLTDVKNDPLAGPVLSKAVIRAATKLKFNKTELAEIIGISQATVTRLYTGAYILAPRRAKEWELALLFIRFFRSLDAILGHETQAQQWLLGQNLALNGRPSELIRKTEGLVHVIQYLDAYRGRV